MFLLIYVKNRRLSGSRHVLNLVEEAPWFSVSYQEVMCQFGGVTWKIKCWSL